jgi:hypothetical protein
VTKLAISRLQRATTETKLFALRFGFVWAILMTGVFAVAVSRNQAQFDNWPKMIAVAVVGYLLILCANFLSHFLSDKRK